MQLRTAVVGAGVVSDTHLSALSACPHTKLVAVCDTDEQRAVEAAHRYDVRALFDVDELLEGMDLDWLHICTPVRTHLPIAKQALEAGIPVNIEKPLTETVPAAEELVELSDRYQVPVSVTHQHQFDPAMRAARQRIESGELGDIRSVDLLYMGETPPDMANRGEWAFDLDGGEFEEGLPHPLYLVLGAGGYPASADGIRVVTDLHGEYERSFGYDGVGVSYRSEDGTLCSAKCVAGSTPHKVLSIYGEKKSLEVDFVSQTVVEARPNFDGSPTAKARNNLSRAKDRLVGTVKNVVQVGKDTIGDDWESHRNLDSHAYQIDAEARALIGNDDLPVPLEEGLWTVQLMEAVRAEANGSRELVVNDPSVTDD